MDASLQLTNFPPIVHTGRSKRGDPPPNGPFQGWPGPLLTGNYVVARTWDVILSYTERRW